MNKIILYISIAIISVVGKLVAQEQPKSFEVRAKQIAQNITTIKSEEKKALKEEVEAIDKQIADGKITKEKGAEIKAKIATERALNIETKVAIEEAKLRELVNENVEEETKDSTKNKYSISIPGGYTNGKKKKQASEKRTTVQAVFAGGYNNLITDGAIANSEFGYARSGFYEWGVTWNTRLSNNSNLLHLKYGAGFMYNQLHATDNRVFADINNQTVLVDAGVATKAKKTYFKNVYFVLPLHLEFDFSETKMMDDRKIFKSHAGMRFGIGGFVGVNTNSKQFIEYDQNGYSYKEKQKGDFNVNDFTYGISTYIGYKQTSLYVKYDLNPIFKNNPVDQNNISMGIRFDWN